MYFNIPLTTFTLGIFYRNGNNSWQCIDCDRTSLLWGDTVRFAVQQYGPEKAEMNLQMNGIYSAENDTYRP